ncbi:LysE family translocator [Starkeya sp. ORNL1]|uniref:LysE family translocator n=1 Tax=Starkeya sp. ORNL1 TaxID=2709380 RepID=UPI0014631632|nr:LysE family translocator [Starkeya sp. ORNL1]QJP14400.1 LysE family translocator [Starkeya sp. ORNL1]
MEFADLIVFAGIFVLAVASPGPAVVALLARTLARGRKGSGPLIAGLILGDLVWLSAAALGMAAVAAALGSLFFLVRLAGAAYLLYLAWKLWTAPTALGHAAELPESGSAFGLFGSGLAISMGNPKTMAFYLALLPTIIDLPRLTAAGFAELSVIIVVVMALVLGAYVGLAHRARDLVASHRAVRWINRVCGGAMAGAAVAVATK